MFLHSRGKSKIYAALMKGSSSAKPLARRAAVAPSAVPFVVKRSSIQGKGVFATQVLAKGTRLIEYAGERISSKEADRRYDDAAMKRHHTFLFAITSRTCIDGASMGNDARFINHSCNSNCEALQVGKRIFIHAKRAIRPGEELTYDYSLDVVDANPNDYPCACGSAKCRGTLLRKDLATKLRRRQPR
jgi:uncharacterized protein